MGMLGPTIVVQPGDELVVVLSNALPFDVNFDPDGGLLVLPSSGEEASGGGTGGTPPAVGPGETRTFRWLVPPEVMRA